MEKLVDRIKIPGLDLVMEGVSAMTDTHPTSPCPNCECKKVLFHKTLGKEKVSEKVCAQCGVKRL